MNRNKRRYFTFNLEPLTFNGRRSSAGFTLIELLAVIAIMLILLVAAVPAFRNLTQQGVETAVPTLTSTLRLARQYAVNNRQYVYVVFPDRANIYDEDTIDMALRSYSVVAGPRPDMATNYISQWRYLPEGVYFDDGSMPGSFDYTDNVFLNFDFPIDESFPFPSSGDPRVTIPGVQFRPDGRAAKYNGSSWQANDVVLIPLFTGYRELDKQGGTIQRMGFLGARTNITAVRIYGRTGQIDVRQR